MRVLIEEYRGWEIYFDTDKEDFYTVSNQYDTDKSKKTYASSKKYIDDYIKANSEFKPINVQRMPNEYSAGKTITLIGVRKDKAFMYEDEKGNKQQLSHHDEKDFFLVDPKNEPHFYQILTLKSKIELLRAEIKEVEKLVVKVTVKDIREKLIK
jgi:hypothetical protein